MSHEPTEHPNNDQPPGLLTPEDIEEFKRLMKETTGLELTDEEAWSRATELVALYRMFLGPIPEDPDQPDLLDPGPSRYPGHDY